MTNKSDGTISLFTGTGAGSATFSNAAGTVPAGAQPGAMVTGEFNGDTDPELAVVNETGDTFSVLTGTGAAAATFNAPIPNSLGAGAGPRGIAIGKFNGDSDPDLVLGTVTSDEVRIFTGGSGVNFNAGATLDTNNPDPVFPAAADMDGDLQTELAVGHTSSNVISVFPITAGVFGAPIQFTGFASVSGIALRDIDGDADAELLATERPAQGHELAVRKGAPGVSFFHRTGISSPGRGPEPHRLHADPQRHPAWGHGRRPERRHRPPEHLRPQRLPPRTDFPDARHRRGGQGQHGRAEGDVHERRLRPRDADVDLDDRQRERLPRRLQRVHRRDDPVWAGL